MPSSNYGGVYFSRQHVNADSEPDESNSGLTFDGVPNTLTPIKKKPTIQRNYTKSQVKSD